MKSVEIKGNVRTDVGSKYAKAERKAERKRLERLNAVYVQMVDNPDDCAKLVKRYKDM